MEILSLIKLASQVPKIQEQLSQLLKNAGSNLANMKVVDVTSDQWTKDEDSEDYVVTIEHGLNSENIVAIVYDEEKNVILTGIKAVDANNIKLSHVSALNCKVLFPYSLLSSGSGSGGGGTIDSPVLNQLAINDDGKLTYKGKLVLLEGDIQELSDEDVQDCIKELWGEEV